MQQFTFRSLLSDVRFWILLYFIARLYYITQPPLEIAHNWRQTTGLMVARNFYEVDPNIFYPRVDMAGDKTGITGTEFPLFNYLIYLTARLFGWADWYGRLINLMVSSVGIYWFYQLLARYIKPKIALFSTLLLLNSIWFAYSRKTMPDTFSLSLVMGGLLYGLNYLYRGGWGRLLLYFLLILAGLLSKIPAGYILALLLFPVLDKEVPLSRKAYIIIAGGVALAPVCYWYFVWVPYLVQHYGFWHYYMGTSIMQGAKEIAGHMDESLQKFYFAAMNFIGFALYLGGITMAVYRKEKQLLRIFILCGIMFFVFMLKAGFAFYHHSYYIIPFVPVMTLMAGYAVSQLPKPWLRYLLLFAVGVEVIINSLPDFRVNDSEKYKLQLEPLAARYTRPGELIAINCDKNPQQVYLSHRKGWNITNAEAQNYDFVQDIKKHGCRLLIINRHELPNPALPYRKLEETADWTLYAI